MTWSLVARPSGQRLIYAGTGSPEGVVAAIPASQFLQTDGAVGSQWWQKQTGTGATGWVLQKSLVGGVLTLPNLVLGTDPGGTELLRVGGGIHLRSTTSPQILIEYDATNFLKISVASNGLVTFDAGGAGAASLFLEGVTVSGLLQAQGKLFVGLTDPGGTEQLRVNGPARIAGNLILDGSVVANWEDADIILQRAGVTKLSIFATTMVVDPSVTSLSLGASPAQSGLLRIPNNQTVKARNAAGTADIELVSLNVNNQIRLHDGNFILASGRVGVTPVGPASPNICDIAGGTFGVTGFYITSALVCGLASNGAQVIEIDDAKIGFYGAGPQVKPTITGSRGGNAALTDLLARLAILGLLTDGTSA